MTCSDYSNLTIIEKREMIAKIQHLIQNDDFSFREVERLIKIGEHFGKFADVKIMPERMELR